MFLFILLLSQSSTALEINRTFEYYNVTVNDTNKILEAIALAAPKSRESLKAKSLGSYQANFSYKLRYHPKSRGCSVSIQKFQLSGVFQYPKLTDSQLASSSIHNAFNKEFNRIQDHERHHESIFITELKHFKEKILKYSENNSHLSCPQLGNDIKKIYREITQTINHKNLKFDCETYGYDYNLSYCNKEYLSGQKELPYSPFSNTGKLPEGSSTVKSITTNDHQDCKGEIIEPFKGAFYCVEGNNRVHP